MFFQQPLITDSSQLPEIEIGWRPSQVTFIAQGSGPFRLLAGSPEVPKKQNFPGQLVSLNEDIEVVELITPALLDTIESQPTSKQDAPTSFNLKKILLWITLIIGVVLMATMAYQLSKKMKIEN